MFSESLKKPRRELGMVISLDIVGDNRGCGLRRARTLLTQGDALVQATAAERNILDVIIVGNQKHALSAKRP